MSGGEPRSSDHPASIRDAAIALAVDRAIAEAVPLLIERGVPVILLKGPSHAQWLYDDPDDRTYSDCDLLVPPGEAEHAESVLGELGFVRGGFEPAAHDRPRYAVPLFRDDHTSVDLHTTFVGVGVTADKLWAILEPRTETMTVGGAEIPVLDPIARSVSLVLHAAKDGGKREGRGDKAIRDLQLALQRIPVGDWRSAAELVRDLDALEAFAAGLRRVPAGESLAIELGLPTRVDPAIALRLEQPPPLAVGVDWLLHGGSGGGRLHVILRKVFPLPDHMRAWSPLARRGPAGLALAYLGRPFWVVWKIVPAMRAVRRARRVTDG